MDGFSSALKISDLNDFIEPSQECIKPVRPPTRRIGYIQLDSGGSQNLEHKSRGINKIGVKDNLERAQITLSDCLACSGCVTSAESVLIQQQNYLDLVRFFNNNVNPGRKYVVASVSPQAKASIAAFHGMSLKEAHSAVTNFLHHKGVDLVLDTTFSRHISLRACSEEFCDRFSDFQKRPNSQLPVLVSACPGWICYAEKSLSNYILPHISSVRSPQAIMGAFVKDYMIQQLGKTPADIYHISIMPCFDKKLEASRKEFLVPETSVREVDCVISTGELQRLIEDDPDSFCTVTDKSPVPSTSLRDALELSDPLMHSGGGSGGYAEQVFRYAAKKLFSTTVHDVEFRPTKNRDLQEAELIIDGEVRLRFATAYGFRNIQSLVQRIKKGGCLYHYVEVMACPSGCLNGGGQIKPEEARSVPTLLKQVTDVYNDAQLISLDSNIFDPLISQWLGHLNSEKANRFLYTTYNKIEKNVTSLNVTW